MDPALIAPLSKRDYTSCEITICSPLEKAKGGILVLSGGLEKGIW